MKLRHFVTKRTRIVALAASMAGGSSCLSACDGDHNPDRLSVAPAPSGPERQSDDEWLRKQERLTVTWVHPDGTTNEQEEEVSAAVRTVDDVMHSDEAELGCTLQPVSIALRTARLLLALATPQSDPITVPTDAANTQSVIFADITTANAAEFAMYATDYARLALDTALDNLETRPSACWANEDGSWPEHKPLDFANAAVEAYHLGRSAYDRAIELTLAIADAARSSTASPTDAARRALLLGKFSRSAAAHLLVGGDDGILGSQTQGYCAGARLAPKAKAALELLRDAAPDPATITDDAVTTDDLLHGTSPGGSVTKRLAAFHQIKELGWDAATNSASGPVSVGLEDYYRLTAQDFAEARQYLRQEIEVFNRSRSAKLAELNGYQRFAGVAGLVVPELPPGSWSARARYEQAAPRWYDAAGFWPMTANADAWSYSPDKYRAAPLSTFIGETYSRIRTFLRVTNDAFVMEPPSDTDQSQVLGTLGSVLLGEEYQGAVELLVKSNTIRGVAHGYSISDRVRIVVGDDGLRCAVQGDIEGADCADSLNDSAYASAAAACAANPATLSCLTVLKQVTPDQPGAPVFFGTTGYLDDQRTLPTSIITNLRDTRTRLYFVKLKDPTLPEDPGNFEFVAGSTISTTPNTGPWWDSALPVVPQLDARVAEVLAPNRKNCVDQSVDCLGVSADARLPLEDELTDDGNGFENSWRHYLTLARQSADEAALRGREFRDAKLNQLQGEALKAQRKEEQRQAATNALQEVQNLCGTALDTNKLLDYLSTDSTTEFTKLLSFGSVCPAGSRCVLPLSSQFPTTVTGLDRVDLAKFNRCLDDSAASFYPYVTLGDQAFCVEGSGSSIVPKYDSSPPCQSPNGEVKPVSYFTRKGGDGGADDTDACGNLRIARGTHSVQALVKLITSNVFNYDRMRDRVGNIGFRAEFGGFFTVTQGGTERLTSGHGTYGRSTGWPWAGTASGCADGGDGLFCSTLPAAATAAQIGAFNARVYRAVMAGAAAEGFGAEIVGPTQLDAQLHVACSNGDHETEYHKASALGPIVPSLPVLTCAGSKRASVTKSTSIEARSSAPSVGWILPDGNTLPGSQLTMWGTGWHRCSLTATTTTTTTLETRTPPLPAYACDYWGSAPPPSFYGSDKETLQQIWGGLSHQALFDWQGNIYSTLFRASTPSAAIFAGGFENAYLSEGVMVTRQTPSIPFQYNLTVLNTSAVLDGLELLCELDKLSSQNTIVTGQVDLSSVDNAADAIQHLADQLNDQAARMFFAHVPVQAADELGKTGPTGAFPDLTGQMGEAVSNLRQAFVSTQHAVPTLANALRSMSVELQTMKVQLEINGAQKQLVDYDSLSRILDEITACAVSGSDVAHNLTSFGIGSAATCANSAAQIGIALKKSSLQHQVLEGEDNKARLAFVERMSENATALQQASLNLLESREAINAALARIDGLKKQAKLGVARALYLASYHNQAQDTYDNTVGALEALQKRRFDEALKNAKLMSWYARRAIEQRLGVSLREMREDLPLVQAPALWEGDACSYSGFQDQSSVSGSDPNAPATTSSDWVAKFGDGFIGDYVTKLENFVESYRITQNFHEGKDTAVISLRDDVANVRARCSQPARNLFKNAGDLQSSPWDAHYCDPVTVNGTPIDGLNCISAVPRVTSGPPPNTQVPDLAVRGIANFQDSATGYSLKFGDGQDCNVADSGGCGWKAGSALSQILTLQPGRYRLSWYTRDDPSAPTGVINGAKPQIVILRPTGSLSAPVLVNSADAPPDSPSPFLFGREGSGADWRRASTEFTVDVSGDYEVGFGVPTGSRPPATQQVTIGAPMLENLQRAGQTVLGNFQDTDADGMAVVANCQDTDGTLFRLRNWKRTCTHSCGDDFSPDCSTGPDRCYREFTFGVSQAAIQNGELFNYSGFARGNFNYRIESLGINFVGTNVRNCQDSSLPNTCFSAGFVPYSLQHNGPFFVRNRAGESFEALLFDGRIEHARGLATERYFTNPISSSDQSLLDQYLRTEFSGRPLDGNFTLRVWEDQGMDFSSIEDVQLILNYRYWTAFD